MKIKIWALVLIIVGSLFLGSVGTFVAMSGVSLIGRVIQNAQILVPRVSIETPGSNSGNSGSAGNGGYFGNGGNSGNGGVQPGQGYYYNGPSVNVPAIPTDLPAGFNAGVNIESTYAALTNRTVADLQTAEQNAGADVWGLANKEGKLNDLKAKITDSVTASLKQMVTDKKITQAQSDEYLNWVKQYLDAAGQASAASGMMPGYGRRGQILPNVTTAPGSNS